MNESRTIPNHIKRQVRQRCGFGCVICGFPIYEYEHMEEWAIVKRHIADEITLLCNNHHRQKTVGLITKEVVKEANKKPFNLIRGSSTPFTLHFKGKEAKIILGENLLTIHRNNLITKAIIFLVKNIETLSFLIIGENIYFSLKLFDENNNLILNIVNNEIQYKIDIWDISFIGKKLKINQKERKILIEIEFNPPNEIKIRKGEFTCNESKINIKKKHVEIIYNNKSPRFALVNAGISFNHIAIINLGSKDFKGFSIFYVR